MTNTGRSPQRRDQTASWFARGGRHGFDNRIADIRPLLQNLDLSGRSVADIGCAEGELSDWLSSRCQTVYAQEVDPSLAKAASSLLGARSNVTVQQADVLEGISGNFHIVLLLGVLHYFDNEEQRHIALTNCLTSAREALIVRTAFLDFRIRDGRRTRPGRYTALSELQAAAGSMFEVLLLDNGARGDGDQRLGDAAIFRRRTADSFPTILECAELVDARSQVLPTPTP